MFAVMKSDRANPPDTLVCHCGSMSEARHLAAVLNRASVLEHGPAGPLYYAGRSAKLVELAEAEVSRAD